MLRTTQPLLGRAQRLTPVSAIILSRPPRIPSSAIYSPVKQQCIRRQNLGPWPNSIFFSTKPPVQPTQRDVAHEKEVAQQKIERHPELVSTQSTVRQAFEPSQNTKGEDRDVLRDAKADLSKVQETIALSAVPSEAYSLGLAGTLPYLATSISTVYLSWDLKTTWPTDSNFLNSLMISHESATQWLQALEPVQMGYGAVLISFLGAIHWGLEWAEKAPSPKRTAFRYRIGVLAPLVAWPTMMLPMEWALISQFLTFTGLYLADSRATTRGWAPPWYGTYRFVLTAIVGTSIVITLVARAKIDDKSPRITTDDLQKLDRHGPQMSYANWSRLEAEEKARIAKEKKEEEKKEKKKKNEEKQQKLKEEKGASAASKDDKPAEEESEDDEAETTEDGQDEEDKTKK